jgi:hypothetical protein
MTVGRPVVRRLGACELLVLGLESMYQKPTLEVPIWFSSLSENPKLAWPVSRLAEELKLPQRARELLYSSYRRNRGNTPTSSKGRPMLVALRWERTHWSSCGAQVRGARRGSKTQALIGTSSGALPWSDSRHSLRGTLQIPSVAPVEHNLASRSSLPLSPLQSNKN